MSINLPVIRYYTPADPYHYTVDNRPIYDLASGLMALKTGIEAISSNNSSSGNLLVAATGTWPLTIDIDLTSKLNNVWCVKLDMWVVENSSSLVNHTLIQQSIAGYNSQGVVELVSNTNLNTVKLGSLTVVITTDTFTVNKLRLTISGYSGPNGYVNMSYSLL